MDMSRGKRLNKYPPHLVEDDEEEENIHELPKPIHRADGTVDYPVRPTLSQPCCHESVASFWAGESLVHSEDCEWQNSLLPVKMWILCIKAGKLDCVCVGHPYAVDNAEEMGAIIACDEKRARSWIDIENKYNAPGVIGPSIHGDDSPRMYLAGVLSGIWEDAFDIVKRSKDGTFTTTALANAVKSKINVDAVEACDAYLKFATGHCVDPVEGSTGRWKSLV